jgi:hypothetical protein
VNYIVSILSNDEKNFASDFVLLATLLAFVGYLNSDTSHDVVDYYMAGPNKVNPEKIISQNSCHFTHGSDTVFDPLVSRMTKVISDYKDEPSVIVPILTYLLSNCSEKGLKFFLPLMYTISSQLVTSESAQIRDAVSQVFTAYAPLIVERVSENYRKQ